MYYLILVLIVIVNIIFVYPQRPNIVFIMADDLGWNDVGFHGSNQIPTPNIDALAYNGRILNKYYVQPMCTPSRSALMTGKHPIHTGMQHFVLNEAEPRGLPLTEKLLPEWLRDLDYSTHCVGKWHLGHWKAAYTPTRRGFDTYLGHWTGFHDYYDHTTMIDDKWGLDMRRGLNIAYDLHGKYSTDIYTEEAVRIINEHNTTRPLFLYLSHAAVHSANDYNPLPASDEDVDKFSYIKCYKRRRYAAILSRLDKSVGDVVKALKEKEILKNTIIVFSSDNGGATVGFKRNYASNWPLRGMKNTLWEGGIRAVGVLWAPGIIRRVSKQLFHISDWLPTLYAAAGGNPTDLGGIDGINMWNSLIYDSPSPRHVVLHNIDDIDNVAAVTYGTYKLITGNFLDGNDWFEPSGRDKDYKYDINAITNSDAFVALSQYGFEITEEDALRIRNDSIINCGHIESKHQQSKAYLFNLENDPCEKNNIAKQNPKIVAELLKLITQFNETAVPPGNLEDDPLGDPICWQNVWTNFGDYAEYNNCRK